MRKALLVILMAVTFNSLCLAQKTINDANAEKRTVTDFHGISVANGIELMLTKGSTQQVAVSASETKFTDKIVTEVVNGILKIHYETNTGSINRKNETKGLKAYVSYTTLD